MIRDEFLPALEYVVWHAGFRHAPRALERVEAIGHRLRDRKLRRWLLRGDGFDVRVVAWDHAFAAYLAAKVGPSLDQGEIRASALSPRLGDRADVTFVEVPDFRTREFPGWSVVPKRVAHVERLDDDESALARRVRRMTAGLRFDVTREPRALLEFDRRLYRPSVLDRHRELARPTPLSVSFLVLARGALLRVFREGRFVSGALIAKSPFDPTRLEIVLLGAEPGADEAARSAPILFARDHARALGYRLCDHLGSPPFVDDGVFQRKRRWGSFVEDMSHRRDRLVVHLAKSAGARTFLARHPFLVLSRGAPVDVRSMREEVVTC